MFIHFIIARHPQIQWLNYEIDYDIRKELHKIKQPTLLLNGEFDEANETVMKTWFKGLEKVKWVTIKDGGHMVNVEQPEKYSSLVLDFLES